MTIQGQLSFKNKYILEKHEKCACYFCLKTYFTKEIIEYVDDNQTALCPYCGVDSVVCFGDGTLPSEENLQEWHNDSFKKWINADQIQKNKKYI